MRNLLCLLVAALAVALVGCGGGDEQEPGPEAELEQAASPQEAVAEIGETRRGLEQALAAYRDGDAAEAERLAGDAYLQHFELVEPPLEERDEELTEELEVLIRETLRDAIVAGEPPSEVERLVDEANRGLDEAERLLRE